MSDTSQRRDESAFTYDVSANETLSEAVIHAVSTVSGAAPVPDSSSDAENEQVLEPLHTAIDPDALESVFKHAPSRTPQPRARVTFSYNGHEVTVAGPDRISVEPLDAPSMKASD